eukprot:3426135-Amphidinium_carterae.2
MRPSWAIPLTRNVLVKRSAQSSPRHWTWDRMERVSCERASSSIMRSCPRSGKWPTDVRPRTVKLEALDAMSGAKRRRQGCKIRVIDDISGSLVNSTVFVHEKFVLGHTKHRRLCVVGSGVWAA